MIQYIADDIPSHAVGDVPSSPVTLTLDTEHAWTGITSSAGAAVIAGAEVTLTLPALDTAGILTIRLTVTDANDKSESVEPIRIAVENPADGWLTLEQAREKLIDSPGEDDRLYSLLAAARRDCVQFAPEADPATASPDDAEAYRHAQLLQAKAIYRASRAAGNDRLGDGEHGVTVFPLDWQVMQRLRPQSAVPGMW